MNAILEEDYARCIICHGEYPHEDMRGAACKWCDAEIGGEG